VFGTNGISIAYQKTVPHFLQIWKGDLILLLFVRVAGGSCFCVSAISEAASWLGHQLVGIYSSSLGRALSVLLWYQGARLILGSLYAANVE
jgi:hypothetical protein